MQFGQRRRLTPQVDLSQPAPQKVASHTTPPHTLRNRAARRSAELVDAVSRLDTVTDPAVQKELADWINAMYEERGGGDLVGLFGHCYLGGDFVDHEMDLTGGILRHFKSTEPPPPAYVGARPLARSQAYLYIEVYSDGSIVPIRHDGSSAI